VARPIPFAAPVITADLPRSRPSPLLTILASSEVLEVSVFVEL
jgi:hypothetical protein